MNSQQNSEFVNSFWDRNVLSTLKEYISIPNKSPLFDPSWKAHGHMDKAVKLISDWCETNAIPDMKLEVIEEGDRTPVILIEIPGSSDETILLYGHLDKQPEMKGWDSDLGPWKPVLKGDKLYGRGGADDGYAVFAALTAMHSLRAQNLPHARCVILIEASEESGSRDLHFYIDFLKDKIGKPNLIICLDSGCGNYDQLWMTTSLRGLVGGVLRIEILKQGIHSGFGSGLIPSTFIILRQLLNRIEEEANGRIIPEVFNVTIPEERISQAQQTAQVLGEGIYKSLPIEEDLQPITKDLPELILNRTWRAALSVIGADGIPNTLEAGNVTLPSLSVKLSMRIPPTCDDQQALSALKEILEKNPPYDAKIHFEPLEWGAGWNAPKTELWLENAAKTASRNYFGADAMYIGEGASIPFMGMLGKKFPQAQFIITGVLGPGSNAHGPNEFLHIPTAKKLTACVAEIIATHYKRS